MTRRKDPTETRAPVPAGEVPPFDPVPRRARRHDGWTIARQRGFIEALADTGSVAAAAKAVNMSAEGAYALRRAPGADSFRAAWRAALDLGVQRIEDVAMDRALNGVEQPVYSYGKLVGSRTAYNDRLLMFMLRNRAPERFAEGRPKRLNALDRQAMTRLKKEWHKEWAQEQALLSIREEQASIEDIVEKARRVRTERVRMLSPRARAAHDEYERLMDEDRANGYDPVADPDHPDYRASYSPVGRATLPELPAPEAKEEPEPEEPTAPIVRKVTDEGWG